MIKRFQRETKVDKTNLIIKSILSNNESFTGLVLESPVNQIKVKDDSKIIQDIINRVVSRSGNQFCNKQSYLFIWTNEVSIGNIFIVSNNEILNSFKDQVALRKQISENSSYIQDMISVLYKDLINII